MFQVQKICLFIQTAVKTSNLKTIIKSTPHSFSDIFQRLLDCIPVAIAILFTFRRKDLFHVNRVKTRHYGKEISFVFI